MVGGVGSIPGALFGGLFVLFVPNIAEHISKGLAGAVYGVILLLVIYRDAVRRRRASSRLLTWQLAAARPLQTADHEGGSHA